jgi:molybdopterin molybdotransferase
MAGMAAIELEDARAAILARAAPLAAVPVPLERALGRFLAEDLVAAGPLQAFDNSAMDGFAVRAADTDGASAAAPLALRLGGESRAGRPASAALAPGEAIAISTGAMIPAGADAVVPIEDANRSDDAVEIAAPVTAGSYLRRAGEDVAAGETVLRAGSRLGAAELAIAAALGADPLPAHRRPRVALVTSGDELAAPGEPLAPGMIRDSNDLAITALAELGGAEVSSRARVGDDREATEAAIAAALDADLAIVCGGVSVGAHDHVKEAFAALGVEQDFWRVALKPGGPTWFGSRGRTLVFGLPGNPVSAFVTFVLLARPALAALAGGSPDARRTVAALAADYPKPHRRAEAIRCRLELTAAGWLAHPAPHQGSHVLSSLLGADCLALIPAASRGVRAGERVEVELLDGAIAARPG